MIDVTDEAGTSRHKADEGSTRAVCFAEPVYDQAAYSEARNRAGLPSTIVADLPLCWQCGHLVQGAAQPARTPESFLS